MKNEFVLIDAKIIDSETLNINNAVLCHDEKETSLGHLTKAGYYSKMPLVVICKYEVKDESGQQVIFISEELAKEFLTKYANLNGKIFRTGNESGTTREKEISKYMHDPHCTR